MVALWLVLVLCLSHSIEGSNICGFRDLTVVCCQGWELNVYGDCGTPICRGNCGSEGWCIGPDVCVCPNGKSGFTCDQEQLDQLKNECPQDCNGRGKCMDGVCECDWGFQGNACETEPTGVCYPTVDRGLCHPLQDPIQATWEACCGMFSAAWGQPCQRCQQTYCGRGFQLVNRQCQDIDECSYTGTCRGGTCKNTVGSFICECPSGYQYQENTTSCVYKPDYCERNPTVCGQGGTCSNLPNGDYRCRCPWTTVLSADGRSCSEKPPTVYNVCSIVQSLCSDGECVPRGFSYECVCKDGYEPSWDRKSCKKTMNICSVYRGLLCRNGRCIPSGNDYRCTCNRGYIPSSDGRQCQSYCDLYPAGLCHHGNCLPQENGYRCECNQGYVPTPDQRGCTVDSLQQQASNDASMISSLLCSQPAYRQRCRGGDCVDDAGRYRCRCAAGDTLSENGQECLPTVRFLRVSPPHSTSLRQRLGPCSSKEPNLCLHGQCIDNGHGDFRCLCDKGYRSTWNNRECTDINECTDNPQICQQGACRNTDGSYKCLCYPGYILNSRGTYCVAGTRQTYDSSQVRKRSRRRLCTECRHGCKWHDATTYECLCPPDPDNPGAPRFCGDSSLVDGSSGYPLSPSRNQRLKLN